MFVLRRMCLFIMNSKEPTLIHAETAMGVTTGVQNDISNAVWLAGRSLLGFAILWAMFYGLFRSFPYLSNGAEVIYRSKLDQELHGSIFSTDQGARRVMIFGSSKVLAGFVPDLFDKMAAADGMNVTSYNSGYPALTVFVPQLKKMVQNKASVPNVILLTIPWQYTCGRFNAFRPLPNDHDTVDRFFPFRDLLRDSFAFVVSSRRHGGLLSFYRESRANDVKMRQDRGYYFISEQSRYPNNSLPENFRLGSDRPDAINVRSADPNSDELAELNTIIQENHIQCYFVPEYERAGEAAPPPAYNRAFEDLLERYTSCKMLGPDYYLFPNHMFSDPKHLNGEGARAYTEALYQLLAKSALGR